MRGRTRIEDMGGGRSRIVITEIPYMVNKARLVEKIAEMVQSRRLEGVSDLREESDRNGMRIVIELKRDVNASVILISFTCTPSCRKPSALTCWRW
jgi:DNA gyrase subunit A